MRPVILFVLLSMSLGCSSPSQDPTETCEDCLDLGPADSDTDYPRDSGPDAELDIDLGSDMPQEEDRLSSFLPRLRLNETQIFGTSATELGENSGLTIIGVIARESGEKFEYERRLYYTDEEPLVQNATPFSPILWDDRLTLVYRTLGRGVLAEFSLEFEPLQSQVEFSESVFGLHRYGNQIVVFGEENISFVESTLLGLEITKQLSRENKPLPDFGTQDQQVIVDNVIYDLVRTMDGGKVVTAWNLEAEGADDVFLGVSELAPGNDIQFSASVEHRLIVSSSNDSPLLELFSLQVPPVFLGTLDTTPYLSRENMVASPTIYKDWLILKTRIRGGDDVDNFVLDLTTENLDCIGQIQDGEFNRFGAANVRFYGLENEIMVEEALFQHNFLEGIPIVSMQPEDFVLGPCP